MAQGATASSRSTRDTDDPGGETCHLGLCWRSRTRSPSTSWTFSAGPITSRRSPTPTIERAGRVFFMQQGVIDPDAARRLEAAGILRWLWTGAYWSSTRAGGCGLPRNFEARR